MHLCIILSIFLNKTKRNSRLVCRDTTASASSTSSRGATCSASDVDYDIAKLIEKLKSTITEGVTPADFEKMTRAWMPGIADGFEQWQKLFLAAIPKPPQ